MSDLDERKELTRLQKEINYHNFRYHVLDEPIISDYEYDMLLKKLHQLEEKYPDMVTPDSPTQRSGAQPLDKFQKIYHPGPILSLANAFNKEDLIAWFERIVKLDARVKSSGFVLEPKIDGLTVVLHYKNGVFVQGATRGDGVVGEDITANLRTVRSLPLRIPVEDVDIEVPERFVVRGEVFILRNDFDSLNQKLEAAGEKTYQNPRNTAAGSLRQLDPTITSNRPLNLLTYAIVDSSSKITGSQWDTLRTLKIFGFPVSGYSEIASSFDEVLNRIDHWMEIRDSIPFEIDGVVIKLNDLALANELGFVGKDPRGSIALKYPAREVTTVLNDIGVNVGRTGVLTPYAILEAVEIGGVIVKQATLHNFDYIADKDIRIKDRIMLKRAGDVIPYVIGPIKEVRNGNEIVFKVPEECPSCGQKIEHVEGEVAYYCVNASCPAQLVRNVEHFVSRGAMDIDGMGIKIVEQVVESGLVKDVADIYLIKKQQLLSLEGFADKKADNLIESIINSRGRSLPRLINALGIRGVGEVASADLARKFQNLDQLSSASIDQLQMVEGIGPNIAVSIRDWFERPANIHLLEKFKRLGIWPVEEKPNKEKAQLPLDGLTFVITGTLPTLSRDEVKQKIEEAGGKVTDSVSRNTDYLVLGENAGSKLDKATALGIKIISEEQLLAMIE